MKRYLVIGLGNFGSWAAQALHTQGHEVIAIDRRGELVDRYADVVTRSIVGDAADRRLLTDIKANSADAAVISTGSDLAASILITLALKDLGLRDIYVKVNSRDAARALEAVGVKETVFPEREAAYSLAHRIASRAVLKYIPLSRGYSIQEIAIPDRWLGQSLRTLQLPQVHGIQVVGIYDVLNDTMTIVPDPDQPLKDSDVAVVAGSDAAVSKILGERAG